jgi:prevent-host-death family protein
MPKIKRAYNLSTARWNLSQIVEEVHYKGGEIILTKHNIPFVAIVPVADLAKLEKIGEGEINASRTKRIQY